MKASLEGIDLKLWRADDHLEFMWEQLMTHSARLSTRGDSAFTGQFDPDSGDYVFRVDVPPPDPITGIRLGEFAHNLRSALDHLIYQLLIRRGRDPEIGKPAFPILEKEPKPADFPLKGLVSAGDLALLKKAQPYNNRSHPHLAGHDAATRAKTADAFAAWHLLALLGFLNNTDKHKHLHAGFAAAAYRVRYPGTGEKVSVFSGHPIAVWFPVGTAIPTGGAVVPISPDGSVLNWKDHTIRGSDDDPTEVARVRGIVIREGAEPKMQMHPGLFIDVAFGNRDRKLSYFHLLLIRDYVREVIGWFAPEFDGPPPRTREVPIDFVDINTVDPKSIDAAIRAIESRHRTPPG